MLAYEAEFDAGHAETAAKKLEATEAGLLEEQKKYNAASNQLSLAANNNAITMSIETQANFEKQQADALTRIQEARQQQAIDSASFNKLSRLSQTANQQLEVAEDSKQIHEESKADNEENIGRLVKLSEKSVLEQRTGIALLGGIQTGLAAASAAVAAGKGRGEAWDIAKRGLIGGAIRDFTGSFGEANEGYLGTMQMWSTLLGTTPISSQVAASGKSVDEIMDAALVRTNAAARRAGYGGQSGAIGAATGRVFTSPHLAMVGEGSQNEVVIPTERIRKGLPINAGVARELGSIGVPGYQ